MQANNILILGGPGTTSTHGPGFHRFDFSAFKNFTLWERYQFQFRAEAFNLTNTPVFDTPGTTYGTPLFGVVTATAFNPHPRVIQFGLRLRF